MVCENRQHVLQFWDWGSEIRGSALYLSGSSWFTDWHLRTGEAPFVRILLPSFMNPPPQHNIPTVLFLNAITHFGVKISATEGEGDKRVYYKNESQT